jgi:hypothetical protein
LKRLSIAFDSPPDSVVDTSAPVATRRALLAWLCLPAVAPLAACALPAASHLYQLRSAPPLEVRPQATAHVWQLMRPVSVPELLERSEILLPEGTAGLRALGGHRWAEPLRDAVPRLLRQDLAALWGESRVWTAPVPAGVPLSRQLRVEILSLQARADLRGVLLQARVTVADISGSTAPRVRTFDIEAPSSSPEPDALVAAHRLALFSLAQQLAAWAGP